MIVDGEVEDVGLKPWVEDLLDDCTFVTSRCKCYFGFAGLPLGHDWFLFIGCGDSIIIDANNLPLGELSRLRSLKLR